MFKGYLYIISFVVLISACDPCDDCDSISFDPTIELVFVNADSLSKINQQQAELAVTIAELTEELRVIDSVLTYLNQRVTSLNERINNGEDLEVEKQLAEDSIIQFNELREIPQGSKDIQDSITAALGERAVAISSGLVLMQSIEIVEIETPITYGDDSLATSFPVPLSIDESFFSYEVNLISDTNTFARETGTFQVDYELFQDVDDDRNVLIRAQNIQIINYSFDSLDACQENCLDGQSTFTFYF